MNFKNLPRSVVLLVSALIWCLSPELLAQEPGAHKGSDSGFTLEQVLSTPFPSDLVAAPTGARIAWVFDWQGRRNIWAAEGPEFTARQLTHYTQDDGQELSDLQFTPDGTAIVYVRGGTKNQEGELPNPTDDVVGVFQQVMVVRWGGGEPRLLGEGDHPAVSPHGDVVVLNHDNELWITPLSGVSGAKPLLKIRGNNGSPQWSPDGRSLAFVSNRGDHSFIGVYEFGNDSVRFLAPSVDRDSTPRWAPDGGHVAFIRQPGRGGEIPPALVQSPEPWSIWVGDPSSGDAAEVWRSSEDPAGSFSSLSGSMVLQWAAKNRIVFTSEQDGWNHFYSLPPTGGEPILLTRGNFEVEQAQLTPDRKFILYSTNEGDVDRRHLWKVSTEGGVPIQVTNGQTIAWHPVVTGDSRTLAYLASDAITPAHPRVSPFPGTEPSAPGGRSDQSRLSSRSIAPQEAMKTFPIEKLVTPHQVMFKAADGLEIHGQLFLPGAGKTDAKLPAIVFMHGGPPRQMLLGWHYLYYYHNAYGMNQYLANRGYAVLSVNYRSGIGYGRAFRMAPNRGPRGASEYQDILAAAEFLRARADIDAAHIGLWGGSYGGYLTALGLARNSDLFAAGVDLHGVHDWVARASRSGGPPAPDAAEARRIALESSPISSIGTWKSPVLLVQGDDDRNVSFSQMVGLAQRLRAAKVPFEQIVFPDEIHDFLLHRDWLTAYGAAAEFFDRKLKPTTK